MDTELKRLKEELSFRRKLEACIHKLSKEAREKCFEELSREIIKNLKRLTGSPLAAVGLWDEKENCWYFPNFSDPFYKGCKIKSNKISAEKGVLARALLEGRTYVSNSLQKDPNHCGLPEGHLHIKRIAIYPVIRGQQPKGLLMIANAPKRYTRKEKEVLEKLGEFYGLLLEAKEAQRKREEMALIEMLSEKVGLALSLWDISQTPPKRLFSNGDFESLCKEFGEEAFESLFKTAKDLSPGESVSRHLKLEAPREVNLICNIKKFDERLSVIAVQDITQELKFQEELNKAERAKAINILAGNLAHKFNNLLTVVITALEVLKMKRRDSELDKWLSKAEYATHDLSILVKQLLLYARGEVLGKKYINLSDFVPKILKFVEALVPPHIVLDAHIERELPRVKIDPLALEQILVNLVVNAVEAYGKNPGRILVKIYFTESHKHGLGLSEPYKARFCSEKEARQWVAIEVRDWGEGIPQEMLQRVLEPFYSTKGLGRGLGLAAVRTMVCAHEGCIVISSRPKDGTSFKILLPVNNENRETT